MKRSLTVDVGCCDSCQRLWPRPLLRAKSSSSGDGTFCPLCLCDSAYEIADGISDLCQGGSAEHTTQVEASDGRA